MKKGLVLAGTLLIFGMMSGSVFAVEAGGEAIFKDKCASCHPDGDNVMKPKANLKGIKNAKKILLQVRKGGGGMPAFDAKSISDADNKLLADYIIKTFKK